MQVDASRTSGPALGPEEARLVAMLQEYLEKHGRCCQSNCLRCRYPAQRQERTDDSGNPDAPTV